VVHVDANDVDTAMLEGLWVRGDERCVVLLDNYLPYSALDRWLERVLLPAAPSNLMVVLASRLPSRPAWVVEAGGRVLEMELPPLSNVACDALLRRLGQDFEDRQRLLRFARGNPMLLGLGCAHERDDPYSRDVPPGRHVPFAEDVVAVCHGGLETRRAHDALEALAVVRTADRALMGAVLASDDADKQFERLQTTPYVSATVSGLRFSLALRFPIRCRQARGDGGSFLGGNK